MNICTVMNNQISRDRANCQNPGVFEAVIIEVKDEKMMI